jgi:hypothetical protein
MQKLKTAEKPDLRAVTKALFEKKSSLQRWMDQRNPCLNELQNRWELKMLERHHHVFQVIVSAGKFKTVAKEEHPVIFNPDKVPKDRNRKNPKRQPTWKLLEGNGDEEEETQTKKSSKGQLKEKRASRP